MKILSYILRITAILAAVVAGTLFFLSGGKLEEKQKEIQQMRTASQSSQENLQTANIEIAALQEKLSAETKSLEETRIQLEEARAELHAEKQEVGQIQKELERAKIDAVKLEETANRLRKELIQTERSLVSTSNESKLAQLQERIDELLAANKALRGSDGLTNFTPQQPLSAAQVAAIEAETTIASISVSKGVIILNSKPGLDLKKGSEIKLIYGLEVVAQVRVTKISRSLVITKVLPGAKLSDLSKGDTVKVLR